MFTSQSASSAAMVVLDVVAADGKDSELVEGEE